MSIFTNESRKRTREQIIDSLFDWSNADELQRGVDGVIYMNVKVYPYDGQETLLAKKRYAQLSRCPKLERNVTSIDGDCDETFSDTIASSLESQTLIYDFNDLDMSKNTVTMLSRSLCSKELIDALDLACLAVVDAPKANQEAREQVERLLGKLREKRPELTQSGVVSFRGINVERSYFLSKQM